MAKIAILLMVGTALADDTGKKYAQIF